MPNRILLTGASGFVGSYLRTAILAEWPDAYVINLGLISEAVVDQTLVAADLLDQRAIADLVKATSPEIVIHLAAQASVAQSADAANMTWSVNLTGSLNLALAVATHAPEAIVLFASTAEVYGASFLDGKVHESSPTLPINIYAKSKLLAEQMFEAVLPSNTQLLVARPFNHTGPGQGETFVLPSFAAQVARIEAGLQPPCMLVGNLDVKRDFLDVSDVVAAYIALLRSAARLPRRFTCNISSGTVHRLGDLLDRFRFRSARSFEIAVDATRLRSNDIPIACGDASLLQTATGWRKSITLDATIDRLLKAARENRSNSM